MYLGYQQVMASIAVQTVAALTIPARSTWVELQATTNGVRYTMDGVTDPTTATGMLLVNGSDPLFFQREDLARIRFCRDGAADGALNLHYGAGRDV